MANENRPAPLGRFVGRRPGGFGQSSRLWRDWPKDKVSLRTLRLGGELWVFKPHVGHLFYVLGEKQGIDANFMKLFLGEADFLSLT